jgi:hypothetical protein
MGFLKKQAEKSEEKKRTALNEFISGEEVIQEFTASMVHPKMTTGIQASRLSFGAVAKASPTICLITKTRLLIAYKNVHPEGNKISDAAKLLAEPVNVFVTSLDDIFDIQMTQFGKSKGMTVTTRNSVYQFVSTIPIPSELIPLFKTNNAAAGTVGVTQSVDVPEQLKKFAELRDQGIITDEEFLEQKKKLLA